MAHQSFTDRVACYFTAWPNRWIESTALEAIGGRCGWRTRVSDVRQRGMVIENRQRTVKRADGSRFVISEYRYSPPVPARLPLFEDDLPVAPI